MKEEKVEEYEGEVTQQKAKGSVLVEINNIPIVLIGMSERGRNRWWENGFVG